MRDPRRSTGLDTSVDHRREGLVDTDVARFLADVAVNDVVSNSWWNEDRMYPRGTDGAIRRWDLMIGLARDFLFALRKNLDLRYKQQQKYEKDDR